MRFAQDTVSLETPVSEDSSGLSAISWKIPMARDRSTPPRSPASRTNWHSPSAERAGREVLIMRFGSPTGRCGRAGGGGRSTWRERVRQLEMSAR